MNITKRRVVSVEEVTAKLDALARRYDIAGHCYDESASDSMSEFDALKWISLCSQRIALQRRVDETASRDQEISFPFRGIYQTTQCSAPALLRNTTGGLNKLAA